MIRAGIPLTDLQQRMLAGERLDPHARGYGSGFAFEIAGDLDVARFQRAFASVVIELDALHLVIEHDGAEPLFQVRNSIEPDLRIHDLSGDSSPRHAAKRWIEHWFPAPFDLPRRLFEGHLLRVSPQLHIFAFTAHHAISDGGCYPILMTRLAAHYRGDESAAEAQPSYVAALEARAARPSEPSAAHVSQGVFPFVASMVDRHAAGTTRFERRFGRERSARFRALATELRPDKNETRATTELFFAICTAYLRRRFDLERFTIGMPLHERRTVQDRASFGLWMRPVAVDVTVKDDDDLAALITNFRQSLSSAMHSPSVPRGNRWFDVSFNAHTYRFGDFAGMPMRVLWLHRASDPIALQFHLRGFERKSLSIAVDVNCAEMEDREALHTIDRVLHLIDRYLDAPRITVGELEIVPPRERSRILAHATGPRVDPVAARVDEVLRGGSSATACLIHRDSCTTLSDICDAARTIGKRLNAAGIGSGATVAIEGERSIDQLAAILGVVHSGAAFVPIDPRWPELRAQAVRDDAEVAAILHGKAIVLVDPSRRPLAARIRGMSDDPLYVLYTSGSTGAPKGVIGTHRGLVRRVAALERIAPLDRDDVLLLRTPIGFVDAVAEIFTPFLGNSNAILLDDDELRDPDRMLAAIERHHVTRFVVTPSLLRALLERGDAARFVSLRLVISSGEELPVGVARGFGRRVPKGRLLNVYGSTEVSADVTFFDATALDPSAMRVPIGLPLDGNEVFVCDDRMALAPRGAVGEIVVAGECLSLGYHARPAEDRERFVAHPLDAARRAYRTGDYGLVRDDGVIEYHGRRDRQQKIRGVRVELEEIEAAIREFHGVRDVAVEVLPREVPALGSYVVVSEASAFDTNALRAFLAARLPAQSVPREIVLCGELPRMSHGKIDRAALRSASLERTASDDAIEGTATERRILAIFAELLPGQRLDLDDDFFACGGDSLLAVDAVISLERSFASSFVITDFLAHPTARALARHLERGESHAEEHGPGILVRLGGSDHGVPLFCVPPAGADPSCFLALARSLGPQYRGPIYGLVPRGIERGEKPDDRIEEIAKHFVASIALRTAQSPVRLLGRCFGGLVAFEMARQCVERGIPVVSLLLLDTRKPPGLARQGAELGSDDAKEDDSTPSDSQAARRRRATKAAHLEARLHYRGGKIGSPTVLVHCGESERLRGAQRAWPSFVTGAIRVRHFPGEHNFLLREPRVQDLARMLAAELDGNGS